MLPLGLVGACRRRRRPGKAHGGRGCEFIWEISAEMNRTSACWRFGVLLSVAAALAAHAALARAETRAVSSVADLNYWASKAKGGIGLIITEDQAVHPTAATDPFVIHAYKDACIEPFTRIASAVHEHGAKLVAQLWHPGSVLLSLLSRSQRYCYWRPAGHRGSSRVFWVVRL